MFLRRNVLSRRGGRVGPAVGGAFAGLDSVATYDEGDEGEARRGDRVTQTNRCPLVEFSDCRHPEIFAVTSLIGLFSDRIVNSHRSPYHMS